MPTLVKLKGRENRHVFVWLNIERDFSCCLETAAEAQIWLKKKKVHRSPVLHLKLPVVETSSITAGRLKSHYCSTSPSTNRSSLPISDFHLSPHRQTITTTWKERMGDGREASFYGKWVFCEDPSFSLLSWESLVNIGRAYRRRDWQLPATPTPRPRPIYVCAAGSLICSAPLFPKENTNRERPNGRGSGWHGGWL